MDRDRNLQDKEAERKRPDRKETGSHRLYSQAPTSTV